jgi:hypothetical protein
MCLYICTIAHDFNTLVLLPILHVRSAVGLKTIFKTYGLDMEVQSPGLHILPISTPNFYLWGCMKEKFMPWKFGIMLIRLIALRWLLQLSYQGNYFSSGAEFNITVRHVYRQREDTLNISCDYIQCIQCADVSPPHKQKSTHKKYFEVTSEKCYKRKSFLFFIY